MNAYPHMCRADHVEIGHADSEHEQCPLCRAIGEIEHLKIVMRNCAAWINNGCDPVWAAAELLLVAGLPESTGNEAKVDL